MCIKQCARRKMEFAPILLLLPLFGGCAEHRRLDAKAGTAPDASESTRSSTEGAGVEETQNEISPEVEAQYQLGRNYYHGENVPQDCAAAIEHLRIAAAGGHPGAQFDLAKAYFTGVCVNADDTVGMEFCRQAAEHGNSEAQWYLGSFFENGWNGNQPDSERAVRWYQRAAKNGHAPAQHHLSFMYSRGEGVAKDESQSVYWCERAAQGGYPPAQALLGGRYQWGAGVSRDPKTAVKWYRKAAEQGNSVGQDCLGGMYARGDGVTQSYGDAVHWFRKAADQGMAQAQFDLALCYHQGHGVSQDYEEAVRWYLMAARQEHPRAQRNLGLMYAEGIGVIQDYVEAYKWFLLAGRNGEDLTKSKRFAERFLTREDLAEAMQRAKTFVESSRQSRAPELQLPPDLSSSTTATTGTGFFFRHDGYILTARHVIAHASSVVVMVNDISYGATVLMSNESSDVAVLKCELLPPAFLTLMPSSEVQLGDTVFTIGFPNVGIQGTEPKYTEGVVNALSGIQGDPRCFQISVPVQPGNSGGPLVNENGQVIGLAVSRLNDQATFEATGSLPQNVNYALKSSFILPILKSLAPERDKDARADGQATSKPSDIIERTKAAVVLIVCR